MGMEYKMIDLTHVQTVQELERKLNEMAVDGWRLNGGSQFFMIMEKPSKGPIPKKSKEQKNA